MKYKDIKDFNLRCEEHPDHQSGMISYDMIQQRLHEEIAELRAYIEQDRRELQSKGEHPAPCARFCEANAFKIEIRNLRKRLEQEYKRGYADAMNWKVQNHLEHLPAKGEAASLTTREVNAK